MQTKSKARTKKSLDGELLQCNNRQNDDELIQIGGICGDGTFTQKLGKGAGSHHGGISYKLYAKLSQIKQSQGPSNSKVTSVSTKAGTLVSKVSVQADQKQQSPKTSKSRTKKIGLKQSYKTKTKKMELYDKMFLIFQKKFKEPLEVVVQELNDDMWMFMAAIASLYDEIVQSSNLVKALQLSAQENKSNQKNASLDESEIQFISVKKSSSKGSNSKVSQSQDVAKQVSILSQQVAELKQSLKEQTSRQNIFKKLLKTIERRDKSMLMKSADESMIDLSVLRGWSNKPEENKRVGTRSMMKKSSKKQDSFCEKSLFSSDDDWDTKDDPDFTLKNLINSMKG